MKTQIEINVTSNGIQVTGPFSAANNTRYRELGGKFQGGSWMLPDNETSRLAVSEMFGSKSELVQVLIPDDIARGGDTGATVQYCGYVLASRRGRDYRVQMPEGVSLAEGSFPSSGGSMKNPSVNAASGTVYRLICRRSFAEQNNLQIAEDTATPSMIEI